MEKETIKKIKLAILIVLGVTVLIGLTYVLISWNKPIDQPLDLPAITEDGTSENDSETAEDGNQTDESLPPTATIEPVCGAPPAFNILVSGVASDNYLYGLADAVRVVRVDFQTQDVTMVALPRDMWVEIPGLESRGITAGKLNQAFFYGTEGMGYYSGSGYGSGLLAETLLLNYDYRADRYLAVSLSSFRQIVDAIGGIDVYLSQPVYEMKFEEPKLWLQAGSHHLNGKQAELLARHRITIGDLGRIDHQTIILKAIAAKMLSPSGVAALPSLIEQLRNNVQTDLSPADISQLVCLAAMLNWEEDLVFRTIPEDLLSEQMVFDSTRGINTSALVTDQDKIYQILSDFQTGLWP